MRKVILICTICFFWLAAKSQVDSFPTKTAQGSNKTLVDNLGGLRGGLINRLLYADTVTANTLAYYKFYNGTQLVTYTDSIQFWIRYNNRWNKVSGGGGGSGVDTAVVREIISDSMTYVKNATTGVGQLLYKQGDTIKAKVIVPGYGFDYDSTTTTVFWDIDTLEISTKANMIKVVGDTAAALRAAIASGGGGSGNDTLWTARRNANHYGLDSLSRMSAFRTISGGGGGTTYATWNPSDKAAGITLSGGNLVAAGSAPGTTHEVVRGTIGKSSGKWYWEITGTSVGSGVVGVATSSAGLTTILGGDSGGWGYKDDGEGIHSGSNVFFGASFTTADVIGFKLDMDAGTLEVLKNNTSVNTFTGLTGTVYPAISSGVFSSSTFTANFGATAFTYSVPSGYNSGIYTSGGGGGTTYSPTFTIDSSGQISLGDTTTNNVVDSDSLVAVKNGKLGIGIRSNFPTRPVEYINKETFTVLPSDMTAVGSPTYTISGGKINFSGTGGGGVDDISQYIRSNFGVLDETNVVSITATVGAAPDANSYGASVGFRTYNVYGATQNLTAGINMATGANFGKIYIYSGYTDSVYSGAANTDINNGDVIKISLITQGWTLRVIARNYTQGWVNQLSLPNVGGFNPLTHNSAYPAFFHNGGTISVDSFNYVINRPVFTDIMFIGNSLTYGQGATQEFKRWVNKVGYSEFNIFSGGGSDVSQNIVDRLPHIIACNPRRVVLHDVVGNDIAQAISSSVWMPNLRTIRNTLVAAGIEVIFTTGSPRTGLGSFLINQKNFIDTCSDFAGDMKIDTWTALLGVGTEPFTDYFTDGVHYNDRGQEVVANTANTALGYETNPGIRFGQNTLFTEMAYGSIYANETYGLTERAGKGIIYDKTIFDRAGNLLMGNPTGSTHLVTAWNFGAGMAGVAAPSALIHVAPSTATAGTGQIKLSNGTLPTTPEIGLLNHKNGLLFFDSSNSKRDTIASRDWVRGLGNNNIYNSNGTITPGDREVDGTGVVMSWNSFDAFNIYGIAVSIFGVNGTSGNTGEILVSKDSIKLNPGEGKLFIDSLQQSSSSTDSVLVKSSTGQIKTRAQSDIGGGGSSLTELSNATDADFTATVNTAIKIPNGTLTANRTVTIPSGSFGQRIIIWNRETTYTVNFTGVSVYAWDESTVTSIPANTRWELEYQDSKWVIKY